LSGELFKYNDNDQTQSLRIGPSYSFGLKNGAEGIINIVYNEESLREDFDLSDDTTIPLGDYSFWSLEGYYQTPGNKPLNMNTQYYVGQFFDGDRVSLTFIPILNLSSTFEFQFTYSYNYINFRTRNDEFVAHLAGVKALAMISTKLTVSAFVQYNNTDNKVFNNFRIRYNPREGNDLFIVYNEGYHTNRYREVPTLPVSDLSRLVVKYTHTFQN
jgi:hypothetical protein